MNKTTSLIPAALLLCSGLAAQNGTAVFEVTFNSTWSKTTHPTSFPSFPHYSPLIGCTHDSSISLWKPGTIARNSIEVMAETGGTGPLTSDINGEISRGNAKDLVRGSGIGSPASITIRFTAHASHPQLTLCTMLAPSPDWFVGLSGYNLMDKNGQWIKTASMPATLWDAGTDSGTSYTSPNLNTNPKENIAVITTKSGPFQNASTSVGTWSIRRIASTEVYGCGVNPKGSMMVKGEARLGESLTFMVTDPSNMMSSGAQAFLIPAVMADNAFPCGTKIPGWGMKMGTMGELLVGGPLMPLGIGTWTGTPVMYSVTIPNDNSLDGVMVYFQGGLAGTHVGLADAVKVMVGK